MTRLLTRTFLLACILAVSASAAFVQVASANYLGGVDITCTSATFNYSTFPAGAQSVQETIFVDGAIAKQTTFNFTGPTGTDTVQFTVPNDGLPHTIEANAYSLTNSTPVFGLPGVATLTCGTAPPPPPSLCTYTKGFYRNHSNVTADVIASTGGTITVGSSSLSAAQAQAVLNATPGKPGNVTFTSNLLLNLVQQLITAELEHGPRLHRVGGRPGRDRLREQRDQRGDRGQPDPAVRGGLHRRVVAQHDDRELQLGVGLRLVVLGAMRGGRTPAPHHHPP